MDQRLLYERQADAEAALLPNMDPALIGRDQFVVGDIRESFSQGMKIAELSIGDGRLTLALLTAFPEAELTCAEIALSRIEQIRRAIQAHPTPLPMAYFVQCNFDTNFDLLPSHAFEVVIALDVMEHVVDVFGFVQHCQRILVPGGKLYLRVPNIAYVRHRVGLLLGQIPITASWFGPRDNLAAWRDVHGWDGGHLHNFTVPSLRLLLSQCGFQILSCTDPGTRLSAFRNICPDLFFANPLIVAKK